jgi:hypothetical protein
MGAVSKAFRCGATEFSLPGQAGKAIAHHLIHTTEFAISIHAENSSHHTHCHTRASISEPAWLISFSDCMVAHISQKCDTYFRPFP